MSSLWFQIIELSLFSHLPTIPTLLNVNFSSSLVPFRMPYFQQQGSTETSIRVPGLSFSPNSPWKLRLKLTLKVKNVSDQGVNLGTVPTRLLMRFLQNATAMARGASPEHFQATKHQGILCDSSSAAASRAPELCRLNR